MNRQSRVYCFCSRDYYFYRMFVVSAFFEDSCTKDNFLRPCLLRKIAFLLPVSVLLIASVDDFWLVHSLQKMDNSKNQPLDDSEAPFINTLTVGAKFQSFVELKNALECYQKANFCQFYVRDSRTLQQAKKFSPKLIQTVSCRRTEIHFCELFLYTWRKVF